MKPRDLAAVAAVVVILSGIFAAPALDRLDGLSIDVLLWLRHQVLGQRHAPADSPSVVVAIDEETYRREPFQSLPKVLWTEHLAGVVDAVLAGGAKVVGFDVIYPTSAERHVRGIDRPLLVTLKRASETDQVVLGKVQHQYKPITPFTGYAIAVGGGRNIRSVNLFSDPDGVVRRVPLMLTASDGREEPAMALELASRAGGTAVIPGSRSGAMAINFDGGPGPIPTYSLADLYACAQNGESDFFRRHFAGKVVVLGVVLDVEDRKLTSMRYITSPEGQGLSERCAHPVISELFIDGLRRDTIPSVYVHAQAVNNLLRGEELSELPRWAVGLIVLVLVALAATATMGLSFASAAAAVAAILAAWICVAVWAVSDALVLPLFRPLIATPVVFGLLMGYRFTIADKDKRYLRRAFSLYLPPSLVDDMIAKGRAPVLGGESREVTVWFSDIADFTTLAEGVEPDRLVRHLNAYLSEMTGLIEDHGGIVDKYIGDAILAVFGAPLDDPAHARHAVEAARACQRHLKERSEVLAFTPERPLATRIGINSGQVLVGNIGSARRFNYTVMGDTVNVAARLESANKLYGTEILASETTVAGCSDSISFREIDRVRVVGRRAPLRIYEPLDGDRNMAAFTAALAAFQAGRFAVAAEAFLTLAIDDGVAARYAERAKVLAQSPAVGDWDGVTDLSEK
jgi:class 3 adenylate cyclase